jgi:nitrogen fixation protein NifU and related proteins
MSKDDMMGPYSEKVMDHFMNPRNMGDIKDADAVGTVGNPACGDVMRLYIKVEGDKIAEAKFKTFGCGAAIATSSMATEMIKDKTLEEASKVTNETVAEALDGLPANKMHCSVLAQEAIEAALKNYKEKK